MFRRAAEEAQLRYDFDGKSSTQADYMTRNPVLALLLIKGDTILYEHYQYGRRDKQRLVSNSMVKTIIAMLTGIAIAEGRIHSVQNDAADYVPELRGSLYGQTSLHTLLEMSSGIALEAPIAPGSKVTYEMRLFSELFTKRANAGAALAGLNRRIAPAGSEFHYSFADNEALTTVLRAAVQRPLASYLEEKIWAPMGAEADAGWAIDASGHEIGAYGFNAVLRDYGRLGRLLAYDGNWNGRQLIPRQWVIDATTTRPEHSPVAPGTAAVYYGYGYQVWILPTHRRMFALIGAGGQYIFVDPKAKLVMVQAAVNYNGPRVTSPYNEALALWLAFVRECGQT
jgi:CubicO group peptidase (beta-lactamase class C family)